MGDEGDELRADSMTARLAEVYDALEAIDRAPDPLRHSEARRELLQEAASIVSAIASTSPSRPSLN